MVNKKMTMRDYYRTFITRANKEAGITYNASKLNSKEECEEYLLNLIKNLRYKKQDNKGYIKEIDDLKEEIEILNNNLLAKNKEKANLKDKFEKLEAERIFYITQADEAKKAREKALKDKEYYSLEANLWKEDYFKEKDKHNSTRVRLEYFMVIILGLGIISIVEAVSIAILAWK
jgi:chromosome segregation ATPase